MTQCPVNSVALRPRMDRSHSAGLRRRRGLPEGPPLELEHRVAPHHHGVRRPGSGHRLGLPLGQRGHQGGGVVGVDRVLVDPADHDLGVEAGIS